MIYASCVSVYLLYVCLRKDIYSHNLADIHFYVRLILFLLFMFGPFVFYLTSHIQPCIQIRSFIKLQLLKGYTRVTYQLETLGATNFVSIRKRNINRLLLKTFLSLVVYRLLSYDAMYSFLLSTVLFPYKRRHYIW